MGKQIVNHNFASRVARSSCAVIPVITPEGNVKQLRVTPSVEPKHWLLCEWLEVQGRKVALQSVSLTTERERAGAMFLRDAYLAEEWPEGWAAYEEYLRACYEREGGVRVIRPRDDLHFPAELLPRIVAAKIAAIKVRKETTEWKPPTNLVRPPIAAHEEIAKIKAEMKAEAKAAK
jgi:hypothetical protein